jgi:hypothetical protein
MPINLTSYTNIESGLFVEIICSKYKSSSGASFTTQALRFSDRMQAFTVAGEVYSSIGHLLSITGTSSELRVSANDLTVSISGIASDSPSLLQIIYSRFKGSTINIYRGIIDNSTGALLSTSGNPIGKFKGIITNYTLTEDFNYDGRVSTNTVSFTCASVVDVLERKITGRRTNPESEKQLYPSDLSMDRVPGLVGSYFDFGVKK